MFIDILVTLIHESVSWVANVLIGELDKYHHSPKNPTTILSNGLLEY